MVWPAATRGTPVPIDLSRSPEPDGLTVRESNAWARDKLAIVECYVSGFSRACSKRAPTWQVVDGFAGPGVNEIKDNRELVWGTPMLCLAAEPKVPRILAMDLGPNEASALHARTEPYRNRITVVRGDVNQDLVPAMEQHLNLRAPTLCILDPEGTELDFTTLRKLSGFRVGRTKAELLILLATHTGFLRTLTTAGEGFSWAPDRMDRLYGTGEWREIWDERRAGLPSEAATARYVQLYASQLRRLGYSHVLDRQIRARGREGKLGYYLVFASQHDTGEKIMDYCFDTRYETDEQLSLFNMPRDSHLR